MNTNDTYAAVRAAREAAEAAAEALEQAEAAHRAAREWYLAVEPTEADTMLRITSTFRNGGSEYTYIVFRPVGGPQGARDWYVTGREGRITWPEVFKRLKAADITIERLTFE